MERVNANERMIIMASTKITIEFDADVAEANVNGKTYQATLKDIANAGLVKVFQYGFQRIVNDRCGGSDRTDEQKDELAKGRINDILSGEIAVRASTPGDPLLRYRRSVVRDYIKRNGSDELKAKYKEDEDGRNALLDSIFDKQDESGQVAIIDMAKKRKAVDDERKAKERELAKSTDMELDI